MTGQLSGASFSATLVAMPVLCASDVSAAAVGPISRTITELAETGVLDVAGTSEIGVDSVILERADDCVVGVFTI